MVEAHEQAGEYHKTRRPDAANREQLDRDDNGSSRTHPESGAPSSASRLMQSAGIDASYNVPVRQAAMRQMQRTHGNRATQRIIQRSPASSQQATSEQQGDDGWPRWLSVLPGSLRTLAMQMGNIPAPITPSAPSNTSASGGGGPDAGGGRSPLGQLFPDLSEEELAAAFRQASAPTGLELPGQNPHVVAPGQPPNGPRIGLQGDPTKLVVPEDVPRTGMRQTTVGEDPTKIAYHENMEFRDIGDPVVDANGDPIMRPDTRPPVLDANGNPVMRPDVPRVTPAPHPRVEVRYHTANPTAPEGTYSKSNPTIQVNTKDAQFGQLPDDGLYKRMHDMTSAERAAAREVGQTKLYRLPDGQWKPIHEMTDVEATAAHYPAGGGDIAERPGTAAPVDAPPAVETGGGWRNTFRPGGAVDRTTRGASYGFQFFGNLSRGQDAGEALAGAAFGGYANNAIGNHLMSKSPKGGLVDMGINLVNSGLQLAGAPEEVTGVTQTIADATPSSFGTSLANNAGRGLWNLGDGLFNGDWSGMKKQGDDIVRGKEGGPLQGYAMPFLAATTSREEWGDITDDMAKGEYGFLPKVGVKGSRWVREKASDLADSASDTWKEASILASEGIDGLIRYKKMKATEGPRQAAWHEMNRKRIAAEKLRHEQFEKDVAALSGQIDKGPAMPGTMLGTQGDALSAKGTLARASQSEGIEDDGEEMPYVPMALPSGRR